MRYAGANLSNASANYSALTTDFLSLVSVTDHSDPSMTKAIVIGVITFFIILFNLLIICSMSASIHSHSMIGYFILSLAGADLATGVFLTPLSIFPALYGEWPYVVRHKHHSKLAPIFLRLDTSDVFRLLDMGQRYAS